MLISRRAFAAALAAGAAASEISTHGSAAAPAARNVVPVHGLFADGSSRLEVIPRLQQAGLNVTSVQNPLTTLPEAVVAAERMLARQDGTQAAWRSKPNYYAVSSEDRTIDLDLDRFRAMRMGAKTIELKSSHVSLISHPAELADLILEAAGSGRQT